MSDRKPFPESIELCKLWAKTSSKTGLVYYVGRLSGARITILPHRNKSDEPGNNHDMVVLLSQAEATPAAPYQPKPAEAAAAQPQPALPLPRPYGRDYAARQSRPEDRLKKPVGGGRTVLLDDPVPF